MSPLPGAKLHFVIPYGMLVLVVVWHVMNCYMPGYFTLLYCIVLFLKIFVVAVMNDDRYFYCHSGLV